MKDLLIYGAGGMAKETVRIIEAINKYREMYNIVGFTVDDSYYKENMKVMGFPVYKKEWLIDRRKDVQCVCCLGYPKDRKRVMEALNSEGIIFESIIHPTAYIDEDSDLGDGCIVGSYSSISPECTLGKGVFLNGPMVVIGHNCLVGDYVTCFPKAQVSGGCSIGEATLVGALAYIHENRKVGNESVIAPGSIVLRDVPDNCHVVGNPAKKYNL